MGFVIGLWLAHFTTNDKRDLRPSEEKNDSFLYDFFFNFLLWLLNKFVFLLWFFVRFQHLTVLSGG